MFDQSQIRMIEQGIIPILINLIMDLALDLQRHSVATLCNLTLQKKCRTILRKKNGIPILVS
jgi:hypothetical protein